MFTYLSISDPRDQEILFSIITISSILGIIIVLPIGGADMPVVVSLLNSFGYCSVYWFYYWEQCTNCCRFISRGFGLILTFIMCKAMNRTLPDVLFKSFGGSRKRLLPEQRLVLMLKSCHDGRWCPKSHCTWIWDGS